jgi:hypothetical protein
MPASLKDAAADGGSAADAEAEEGRPREVPRACDKIRESLKDCLKESDCVRVERRSAKYEYSKQNI